MLGRPVHVLFEPASREVTASSPALAVSTTGGSRPRDEVLETDSMVRKVVELFEARRLHSEYEEDPPVSPSR